MLTAAAGMAGKHDIATAALQELRRAQPNITLAWLAKDLPMRQNADREPNRAALIFATAHRSACVGPWSVLRATHSECGSAAVAPRPPKNEKSPMAVRPPGE
jgi:hypothetical protein